MERKQVKKRVGEENRAKKKEKKGKKEESRLWNKVMMSSEENFTIQMQIIFHMARLTRRRKILHLPNRVPRGPGMVQGNVIMTSTMGTTAHQWHHTPTVHSLPAIAKRDQVEYDIVKSRGWAAWHLIRKVQYFSPPL
ncbi:hypothetical protein K435DRAFT_929862 [Dendrothele bispora CBS 962.96]|uniref:Uncharacterized protein n=1 Tax=Dendrothele bispora (strain CBS 962.96) TaxID=1314807 RepID=A0A4S8L5P1_DENBC|nr:hypothetical protein K435DRAFT_929862 [Dendrothele bispora CBS 962.96]